MWKWYVVLLIVLGVGFGVFGGILYRRYMNVTLETQKTEVVPKELKMSPDYEQLVREQVGLTRREFSVIPIPETLSEYVLRGMLVDAPVEMDEWVDLQLNVGQELGIVTMRVYARGAKNPVLHLTMTERTSMGDGEYKLRKSRSEVGVREYADYFESRVGDVLEVGFIASTEADAFRTYLVGRMDEESCNEECVAYGERVLRDVDVTTRGMQSLERRDDVGSGEGLEKEILLAPMIVSLYAL